VIALAATNAPWAGFPQLSWTREIWSRYTRAGGVDDREAQLGEMYQTYERYAFPKEDFPFPEEFYASVGKGEKLLASIGYRPADDRLPEDARARSPKMHRKTQLFLTGDALAAIARDKRTQDVIRNQMRFIAKCDSGRRASRRAGSSRRTAAAASRNRSLLAWKGVPIRPRAPWPR